MISENPYESPISPAVVSSKPSWFAAILLAVPVAAVTFVVIVFLTLLLTPAYNMARMATNSNAIGYITFALSPLAVLVSAMMYLRRSLQSIPPIPSVAIGITMGAIATLLFNLPGGIWMFIEFD